MIILSILTRILYAALGFWLVLFTIGTAIRTFVLPRGENAWLSRQVFRLVYKIFLIRAFKTKTYSERDQVMAFFAPVVLLVLPVIYLTLIMIGYTPIYWALDPRPMTVRTLIESLHLSGSSLMTLGFAAVEETRIIAMEVSFSQAAVGMILVALLIAYLPTIYNAFSQREKLVSMLEIRAGSPPAGVTLLERVYRNGGDTDSLDLVWSRWEEWFAEIEESHTSLVALVFFRSPMPDRHWITAAGAVLDAAALYDSTVDMPRSTESVMMIRAGYLSLRRIADFFGTIPYNTKPLPTDPISISKDEYLEVYEELRDAGVPVVEDVEAAWASFAGWRVNYDRVLLGLARITSAPYALWSSDRSLPDMRHIPGFLPSESFEYRPRYEREGAVGD